VTNGTLASSGTSADLAKGILGAFDAHSHVLVTAANAADHPQMYFAQGSFYDVDTIGNGVSPLVALQNSYKTPYINAKYVTKFYKTAPVAAQNMVILVDSDGSAASVNKFEQSKPYTFRYDITGTPVLRILGRTQYWEVLSQIGCPVDDCSGDCSKTYVDPALIYLDQANQVNNNPQLNQFIKLTAQVDGDDIDDTYVAKTTQTDIAAVKAGLKIEVGYIDTKFGNCSFKQADYVALEPMIAYVSAVRDLSDLCATYVDVDSRYGKNAVVTQHAVQAEGVADNVIKDYLLSREYEGIGFNNDPRHRETEQDPIFDVIDRSKTFYSTYIEFLIPNRERGSVHMSENRFLYRFAADSEAKLTAFNTFVSAWLSANNSDVTLEDYSA